jgi:hypothetical protein
MLLLTIYEKIQMSLIVNFKGMCASTNICRMTYPITDCSAEADQKTPVLRFSPSKQKSQIQETNRRILFNQPSSILNYYICIK